MSRFDLENLIRDLLRRVLLLETTQPMGFSAVSEGRSRFVGNESILVQGSGKVEGWWIVTGTQRVTGRLEGSGTLDWTGPWYLRGIGQISGALDLTGPLKVLGSWDLQGDGQITGDVDISGALDVLNRLTLSQNGYLEAGTVRLDRFGDYGGRLISTGNILQLGAGSAVLVSAPELTTNRIGATHIEAISANFLGTVKAAALELTGPKQFVIDHPTKNGWKLGHGSTESPVSGVEYWGEETLPESGQLAVALPDYFEALTKQKNRAVMVTARGFIAEWGDVVDGVFTVRGKPGGRFSWLVKAERHGADFDVEIESVKEPVPARDK